MDFSVGICVGAGASVDGEIGASVGFGGSSVAGTVGASVGVSVDCSDGAVVGVGFGN